MRKKKIGIAPVILLVMAAVLSIRAHAAGSPQTVIDADGSGTTISVTDITPREDKQNETKDYTIGSYYPVEVQTAEDHGIQLLVKTFLVPEGTDPQTLVEGDLTQRGISYEVSDILRQDMPGEIEKKTVSQTVTLESETEELDDILLLLSSSMDYHEDGFAGMLALDKSSIRRKETGTSGYSYQLKETKEFTGLDRNDPYYIPKTTEKNGVTLTLSDVQWTPMASGADNSEVPSLYRATAVYTGTAWGSKADGYIVTADYTGEVSRTTQGTVKYSIVYEEIQGGAVQQTAGKTEGEGTAFSFPWKTGLIVIVCIAVIGAGGFGIFWMVATRPRKRRRSTASRKPMQAPQDAANKNGMEVAL